MNNDYLKEQRYIKAQKRVKDIRGFYSHLSVYIVINIFISGIILYGFSYNDNFKISNSITHFSVYSTWLFWGIGLFFHWFGVFGFKNILGKSWEEKKIKELMRQEDQRSTLFFKKTEHGNRQ